MTAFNRISNNQPRTQYNQKDGRQPRPKSQDWEGAGFVRTGWNSHSYTWQDDFPVFTVKPGMLGQECGIVARCGDIAEIWAYGTCPLVIKEWADEQILQIMRHDADPDGSPVNWQPVGVEIDIDAYMAV